MVVASDDTLTPAKSQDMAGILQGAEKILVRVRARPHRPRKSPSNLMDRIRMPLAVSVREVAFDHPDAVSLRHLQQLDIAEKYDWADLEPDVKPSAQDSALFCVAYNEELMAVGCGGLRQLSEERVEIKRMYVTKDARGSGAATAVLLFLERFAKQRGFRSVVLETGDRLLDATRFYERNGYLKIDNYGYKNAEATSIFMEKVL